VAAAVTEAVLARVELTSCAGTSEIRLSRKREMIRPSFAMVCAGRRLESSNETEGRTRDGRDLENSEVYDRPWTMHTFSSQLW